MAVTALIQFTQGPNTDVAGRAVLGTLTDGACTISNGDNTNVVRWVFTLLFSPPGSALTTGVKQDGGTATYNFTPDVVGSYRWQLDVYDAGTLTDQDIRVFSVPNFRDIVVPPYQKLPDPIPLAYKSDEMNFGGQAYGWLGTRTSKMMEQFFLAYHDEAPKTVSTTPYNATADEADIYLVDPSGSAITFNLPSSGLRVGQIFKIKDSTQSAYTHNITVNLPGGHTFSDATSAATVFANGGMVEVMYAGGTSWRRLRDTNRREHIALAKGDQNTSDTGGYTRIGAEPIDTSTYPANAVWTCNAILETTNAANAAQFRLYNYTDSSSVGTLSTTSTTPSLQTSSALTIPSGTKLYFAQLQMGAGAAPDRVTCCHAELVVVYAR